MDHLGIDPNTPEWNRIGTISTADGPCPQCGAAWAYDYTTEGWDGSLPCTRVDMFRKDGRWFLRCPDCDALFKDGG